MKQAVTNVTVNGQPLEVFLGIQQAVDVEIERRAEIKATTFRTPASGSRFKTNTSGARTGRGRVIYSASASRFSGVTPEQAMALDKLAAVRSVEGQ